MNFKIEDKITARQYALECVLKCAGYLKYTNKSIVDIAKEFEEYLTEGIELKDCTEDLHTYYKEILENFKTTIEKDKEKPNKERIFTYIPKDLKPIETNETN